MHIKGKKITLRAVEESDLDLLHKWANDPITQDSIGLIYFPSSMEFHKDWFQKLKNSPLDQRLAIETPDLGLIGISSICKIDWRNNHAWHGMILGDKDIRGKGYGQDALLTTMRYAFDEMHLERLDGSIIEYNAAAYHLYVNKTAWKEEGRKKNYYFHKGRYWDQFIVGVTKQDYYNLIAATDYWNK